MVVVSGVVRVDQVKPASNETPLCPTSPRKTAAVGVAKSTDPPYVVAVIIAELQETPPFVVRMKLPLDPLTSPTDSLANAIEVSSLPNELALAVVLICQVFPLSVERKTRGLPPRPLAVENHALLPEVARLFTRPYSPAAGAGMFDDGVRVHELPPFEVV
jgi:hypothetical protein